MIDEIMWKKLELKAKITTRTKNESFSNPPASMMGDSKASFQELSGSCFE
jgi:hypothetical protein